MMKVVVMARGVTVVVDKKCGSKKVEREVQGKREKDGRKEVEE